MPEYEAALRQLTQTQDHIAESVGELAHSLTRASRDQEARSRERFTLVYRILAAMIVLGVLVAAFVVWRQQDQLTTLNTIVGNQQAQIDTSTRSIAERNRQFDLARQSDLCAQKLNAGFFGVIASGSATPVGSPERKAAQQEFERIGRLYDHENDICYGPNPSPDPVHAALPPN